MDWLTNFHSHCFFCDGCAPMEVFVHHAIAHHMNAYGISSHAPVPFSSNWAMRKDDLDEYLQEFHRLKQQYENQIELYVGMEMDFLSKEKDSVFRTYQNLPLDYRIGSVHYIDTLDNGQLYWNIGGDPKNYKRAICELFGGDIRRMIRRYFQQTNEMIESADFDIIGHVDKITDLAERFYAHQFDPNEPWYLHLIDETFSLAKEYGKIIEINTKGVETKHRTFPHRRHFRRIQELGIPVMVNSDAHKPDCITCGFRETYQTLRECGFRTVRILKNNRWTDMEL